MKPWAWLCVAAAAALSVACGPPASQPVQQVGLVTLSVTGGIAGWNRTLTVDSQGAAELVVLNGPKPSAGPHAVTPEQLARLRATLRDPAFSQLAPMYPPPPGGADLQMYQLSAEIDGRHVQTTTYDGVVVPTVLRDALRILNEVIASFGSSP